MNRHSLFLALMFVAGCAVLGPSGDARGGVTRFSVGHQRSCSASEHTIIARQVGPALDEAVNTVGPSRPLFNDWPPVRACP